jgi:nucleotide-binding universal stress UspA family protein
MSTITKHHRTTPARAEEGAVIVVGYDGSEESRRAVEVAAERAGPDGTVIPIHVMQPASSWLGASAYEPVVARNYQAAHAVLADMMRAVDTGDASIEPELIEGDPPEAILRVAQSRNAREIVVGSRGRGRFRALLGSTSHALVETADRPVIVVPKGAVDERH